MEYDDQWTGVKNTGLKYRTKKILGSQNHDYYENMKEADRSKYQAKTSEILNYINAMFEEGILEKGGNIFDKMEKFGEVCEWENLTKKVLDEVAYIVKTKTMEEAQKVFAEKFVQIKYCQIRGALSPGEIQKIFEKKDMFLKFYDKFDDCVNLMKKVWKQCNAVNRIWSVYRLVQSKLKTKTPQTSPSEYLDPLSENAESRKELIAAKKQMGALINLCSGVLTWAPIGIKEYIQFNLDVFNAVDQAMGLIDKYAEKIDHAAEEIVALFEKAMDNPNSAINLRRKAMNERFQADITSDSNRTKKEF